MSEDAADNGKHEVEKDDLEQSKQESSDESSAEVGGRKGPEPTRFGDWEKNGRCIDF